MKIPKTIKIGESTYNIKIRSFINFLNPSITGQIRYDSGVIKIKKRLIHEMQKMFFFMKWYTEY